MKAHSPNFSNLCIFVPYQFDEIYCGGTERYRNEQGQCQRQDGIESHPKINFIEHTSKLLSVKPNPCEATDSQVYHESTWYFDIDMYEALRQA